MSLVLVVFTDIVTSVVVVFPFAMLSSTAVRVTSRGVLQLSDVNVKESGLTVTLFVSNEAISKTTSEVGLDVNTTVNVSDSPSFTSIVSLLTVKPATPPEPPSTSTNIMFPGIP